MKSILLPFSLVTLLFLAGPANAFDQTHAAFTKILASSVHGEGVDYAKLKKNPGPLGSYLATLSKVNKPEFKGWKEKEQLAYLINLYNAATLKLVVDHYPVKSIKKIGGLFGSPWKKEFISLFGDKVSLDHVEHELLRKNYNEPRIHFAVNCASIGCPPLRAEAFQASKLDAQLNEQARAFLRDTSKNRFDAGSKTLYLSPIFKWFSEDFVKGSGSVANFVVSYFPESTQAALRRGGVRIKHTDYDWDLNKK